MDIGMKLCFRILVSQQVMLSSGEGGPNWGDLICFMNLNEKVFELDNTCNWFCLIVTFKFIIKKGTYEQFMYMCVCVYDPIQRERERERAM